MLSSTHNVTDALVNSLHYSYLHKVKSARSVNISAHRANQTQESYKRREKGDQQDQSTFMHTEPPDSRELQKKKESTGNWVRAVLGSS